MLDGQHKGCRAKGEGANKWFGGIEVPIHPPPLDPAWIPDAPSMLIQPARVVGGGRVILPLPSSHGTKTTFVHNKSHHHSGSKSQRKCAHNPITIALLKMQGSPRNRASGCSKSLARCLWLGREEDQTEYQCNLAT